MENCLGCCEGSSVYRSLALCSAHITEFLSLLLCYDLLFEKTSIYDALVGKGIFQRSKCDLCSSSSRYKRFILWLLQSKGGLWCCFKEMQDCRRGYALLLWGRLMVFNDKGGDKSKDLLKFAAKVYDKWKEIIGCLGILFPLIFFLGNIKNGKSVEVWVWPFIQNFWTAGTCFLCCVNEAV